MNEPSSPIPAMLFVEEKINEKIKIKQGKHGQTNKEQKTGKQIKRLDIETKWGIR
jgi:hypothetical protein